MKKNKLKFISFFLSFILVLINIPVTNISAITTIDNDDNEDKVIVLNKADYDDTGKFKTCDKLNNKYLSISSKTESEAINKIVSAYRNTESSVNLSSYNIPFDDIELLVYKSFNADLLTFNCYSNLTISCYVDRRNYVTNLIINYADSAKTFKSRYNKLNSVITNIVNKVNSNMSPLEKALFLHDYIVKNTAYDYENLMKGSVPLMSHSAYNVLVNNVGVCDGYSNAYKLLLDRLNINSIIVTSDSMNHAWNMIKINNNWYHADLTWDDAAPDSKGLVRHTYFLRSDNEMKNEYEHYGWVYSTGSVPSATSTAFSNWFMHNIDSEAVYNSGYWYYPQWGKIYKSDIYGNKKSCIKSDNSTVITSYNNRLYYDSNYNTINSCDFNGNNTITFYKLPNNSYYSNIDKINSLHIGDNGYLTAVLVDIYGNYSTINKEIDNNTKNISNCSTNIKYSTQVQKKGWLDYSYNGASSGTIGESLRLESIKIEVENNSKLGVSYSTQVEKIGWQNYVSNNAIAGTVGKGLRMETIKINLTGSDAPKYDIYYRVHAQKYGWLGWAKNGEAAGTVGYALRLEAIEIVLVNKGEGAPGSTNNSCYIKPTSVSYRTHVQSVGWQNYVADGKTSGTTGRALRLEAVNIKLSNQEYAGSIKYRTHIQKIGWQDYKTNNELSGTAGKGLRLEAIEIELTDEISKYYDIYYRVHAQNYGWLGWAKNGSPAGTSGYGLRLEGLQIILVKKGAASPTPTSNAYVKK